MKKILLLLPFFLWACGGGGGSTEPEPPQLPTVTNIEVTTSEDTPKNFFLGGSEPNNLELTYSLSTQPQHGSISISLGAATYTPNANYNGQDVFAYLASSTAGNSNIGTIVVTITPVDDEPVSKDITVSTDEDTPVDITLEVDEFDGENVNFNIIENPRFGTVSINGNIATYEPDGNWFGSDYFTYEAVDSNSKVIMNVATVNITVNPIDDPVIISARYGLSIKETDDGGYIIGGRDGGSGSVSAYPQNNDASYSVLFKTDSDGNLLWLKDYDDIHNTGASGYCAIYDVEIDYDGGYIFTGFARCAGDPANPCNIVVKTDSSGEIIWKKQYSVENYPNFYKAYSITKTYDGGYAIVGNFLPYDIGGEAVFIHKIDSQGNAEWSNMYFTGDSYSTDNQLGGYFVEQTNDGGFIVGGPSTYRVFNYFKIDNSGNIEWQKIFGESDTATFTSVDLTVDGGFIFLGHSSQFSSDGGYSLVLYKTDSEGNEEWLKTFDSTTYDFSLRAVHQTSDGGYVFVSRDFVIYKVDNDGNEVWRNENIRTNLNKARAYDMIITYDNNYVIIGANGNDSVLVKINEYGNQVY